MRLTLSLIVMAALVKQTIAVQLQPDGTLVNHPPQTLELDNADLVARLSGMKYVEDDQGTPIPEQVAGLLYTAKDKSTMLNGVSVEELIDLNSFHLLDDCSQDALEERVASYMKAVSKRPTTSGIDFAIHMYALKCLHLATGYCLEHKQEVISKGINNSRWMSGLGRQFEWEHQGEDNYVSEFVVGYGYQGHVAAFIEFEKKKRMSAALPQQESKPEQEPEPEEYEPTSMLSWLLFN